MSPPGGWMAPTPSLIPDPSSETAVGNPLQQHDFYQYQTTIEILWERTNMAIIETYYLQMYNYTPTAVV